MKFIHTSDWHLGARLHNYDRSDEETDFFRQLADLVDKEHPDALVVSGDIFHTGAPGNDVAKSFTDHLLDVVSRCPEMETVVIAGNHDSYSRLVIDEALWKHCRVHVFGTPVEDEAGNAILDGNIVALTGKGYIAAVPFCHARNFPMVTDSGGNDRAKAYFAALSRRIAELNATKLPCVLMAHLAAGKDTSFTGQDRLGVIGGEECVDPETLGTGYDYIALGHIHCPQWVKGGRKTVRYCGTPRAIHFDEAYSHGVDIVEVVAGQDPVLRTEVIKPMRDLVTVGGRDGVAFEDALKAVEQLDDPSETYVRLNVALDEGGVVGADWAERARLACSAKNYRYCVINPIRKETAEKAASAKKVLTVAELKELSNEKVVDILSEKYSLTPRQRELIKALMKEMDA